MICECFNLFVIELLIGFISGAVYYIVPSPSHHCPNESCLTLSSFAANATPYIDNNTSLIFQPGNHIIRSVLTVTNVNEFSMRSATSQPRAGITCENDTKPGFVFNGVIRVHVSNLKLFECYSDINDTLDNVMTLIASNLVLVDCLFEDTIGTGMVNATNSNISLVQSTIMNNNYIGSTINSKMFSFSYCNITIRDTKFTSNKIAKILYAEELAINTDNCTFNYNHGSAMFLVKSTANISNSFFNNNEGHAVLRLWNTSMYIHDSAFKENVNAGSYKHIGRGGAIFLYDKTIIWFNGTCTFTDNKAEQGGAIYVQKIAQCIVENGATMIIANNTASGGIYRDTYDISGDGGGIYLDHYVNLTLHSQSTLRIVQNSASAKGGGIHLSYFSNIILHSQAILQILENKATENGGGIYAMWFSSINLGFNSLNDTGLTSSSAVSFRGNQARYGGGLYLGSDSKVHAFSCVNSTINFIKNSADYGGAVYVSPKTISETQYYDSDPECFFQSVQCENQDEPFYFSLNRANYSGISLYKGAFWNCSMGGRSFGEFELVNRVSNIQTSDVGSTLVQVCYCDNGLPDCSKQIPYVNVKTGEKLILHVAIADRGNHVVSGSIVSEIGGSMHIRDDQKVQNVTNACTPLVFNIIFSIEKSQQLIMLPRLKKNSMHKGLERLTFLHVLVAQLAFNNLRMMQKDVTVCVI